MSKSSSESESSTRKGSGTSGSECFEGTAGGSGLPDEDNSSRETSLSIPCDSLSWEPVCSLDSPSSRVVKGSVITPADEAEVDFSIPGLSRKEVSLLPDLGDAGNVNGGVWHVPTTGTVRRGEMVVVMTLALVGSLVGSCSFLQLRTNFLSFLANGSCILAVGDLGDVDIVSLGEVKSFQLRV